MALALACFCVFTKASRGEDDAWMTDFAAAKSKAKAEKKLLLVDFTGSDWCIWCKRLHGEVFEKDEFKTFSPTKFVMVELDFPHEKKISDELKEQNANLAKKYKIRGYPTVLLLDPEGEVIAHTGYRPGGPEKYVENLTHLVKLHDDVVDLETQLAKAEGLSRAKLLDRLVEATTELNSESEKIEPWTKEIIALDVDNKAGLKGKYEIRQLQAEIARLMQTRKFDEAHEIIEKMLAMPGLTGAQKQDAYASEATIAQVKMDRPASLAALTKAVEAAPESSKAAMLKSNIARIEQTIKYEEEATKLAGQLADAKGEDRLKLLDETVTAYAKIGNHINGKDESASVAKWMSEIIKLDDDNKAGLKAKYEYQSYFNESQKLLVSHKSKEALEVIEKALAISDLKPEQISRATLMKCNCLLMEKKYQAAIDCAKKAQETATGTEALIFRLIIQQAEKALKAGGNAAAITPIMPTIGGAMPAQRIRAVAGRTTASGKTAGDPAATEKSTDEKTAEKDPFKVPSGSVEDLFKYIADLKKQKSKASDYMAILEFRRKMAMATIEAADKIIAADPTKEQKCDALKIKLEAFGSMPSILSGNDLVAKQEELIEQFEKADMPKEARQVLRIVLATKLQSAGRKGPAELEKVLEKIKDYFQSGSIDSSAIGLAASAGRAAEASGSNQLAIKTYRELGKIFATQKDEKVAQMAAKFVGAARRMGLKENTMLVEGTTLDGKPLDWSKFEGKVVLIDFWATWCGPCRAELPNVRKNYEAYHDRGFEVIGISLDQKREDLDKFMEKEKLPWTIVTDDSWNKEKPAVTTDGEKLVPGHLADYYGVFGIPTMILLGKDGKAITISARGEALNRALEKEFGPITAKAKDEDNK
jgi:thiol-disulfide isomerase/thioredoxin